MPALVLVHLVGMAIFVGGSLAAFLVHRAATANPSPASLDAAHITLGRTADSGLVLLLLSGVAQISMDGMALFHQAWLHIMLTAFVLAGAASGIATSRTRKLGGAPAPEKRGVIGTLRLVALACGVVAAAAGTFKWGL